MEILELNNTLTEMENSLNGLNRLRMAEERISYPEDRSTKNIQTKESEKKKIEEK